MNLETAFINAPVLVTVLTTHGDIDGSNYRDLIDFAGKLIQTGTRNILLDLGDTAFMSSAGLVALHSIALMLNGESALNIEDGWNALRAMSEGPGEMQSHLKLLHIPQRVAHTLEITGLKGFYEVFSDREEALASFQPEKTTPAEAL